MHDTQTARLPLPLKLWVCEDEHVTENIKTKSVTRDLKCSFFSPVNEVLRQEVVLSLSPPKKGGGEWESLLRKKDMKKWPSGPCQHPGDYGEEESSRESKTWGVCCLTSDFCADVRERAGWVESCLPGYLRSPVPYNARGHNYKSSPSATQGNCFTVKLEGLWDYMVLGRCPVFLSQWWYRNWLVAPIGL